MKGVMYGGSGGGCMPTRVNVFFMMELMVEYNVTDWIELQARADVKLEKLKKWSTIVK